MKKNCKICNCEMLNCDKKRLYCNSCKRLKRNEYSRKLFAANPRKPEIIRRNSLNRKHAKSKNPFDLATREKVLFFNCKICNIQTKCFKKHPNKYCLDCSERLRYIRHEKWKRNNKDKRSEYGKQYRQKNLEKFKQYKRDENKRKKECRHQMKVLRTICKIFKMELSTKANQ